MAEKEQCRTQSSRPDPPPDGKGTHPETQHRTETFLKKYGQRHPKKEVPQDTALSQPWGVCPPVRTYFPKARLSGRRVATSCESVRLPFPQKGEKRGPEKRRVRASGLVVSFSLECRRESVSNLPISQKGRLRLREAKPDLNFQPALLSLLVSCTDAELLDGSHSREFCVCSAQCPDPPVVSESPCPIMCPQKGPRGDRHRAGSHRGGRQGPGQGEPSGALR